MRITIGRIVNAAVLFCGIALVAGCATQSRYYSSAVEYLYPTDKDTKIQPSVPVMKLPLKVAIAFVPDASQRRSRVFWQGLFPGATRQPAGMALTEKQKIDLMQKVSTYFKKYPYVGNIDIIPSAYLTPAGGFSNLDQLRTMYGVDVVALLAYDQVQFTDEGAASFLYWTVVGAYVIPGEKNTTQTMLDAVVYDIKSRKMLFRAPGTSQIKGSATPVNLTEELRRDSEQGFEQAADNLVKNLDAQLSLFKDKVKASPQEYKVVHRKGYTGGGGSSDILFLVMLVVIGRLASGTRENRSPG